MMFETAGHRVMTSPTLQVCVVVVLVVVLVVVS